MSQILCLFISALTGLGGIFPGAETCLGQDGGFCNASMTLLEVLMKGYRIVGLKFGMIVNRTSPLEGDRVTCH